MSFCGFVKDSELRYDLRAGTVRGGWEEFIPSLADRVRGGEEYLDGCAACDLRGDCRWCGVYGALEHGRLGARVDYLCDVARASRAYADDWAANHTRYFEIAGITVKVESDLPITDSTFEHKFEQFRVDGPGEDTISIRHHFGLPELDCDDLGEQVYRKPPWAIYRKGASWIYLGIAADGRRPRASKASPCSTTDHTRGAHLQRRSCASSAWRRGGVASLDHVPDRPDPARRACLPTARRATCTPVRSCSTASG